jgi:hypothetical protein
MRKRSHRPNNPRPLARLSIALASLGAALPLALFSGCGEEPAEVRRGAKGDSCQVTNDCEAPHACIMNVCGGPVGQGGSDPGDAGVVSDGPSAEAGPWNACDGCLDMKCAPELEACTPECVGIEACLEELCANLSSIGSADEGKCQTTCQGQYPGGKDAHIAVVDCAIKATCRPPCESYPEDYDGCRAFMNKGDCAGALAACEASAECLSYRSCVGSCSTLTACTDCGNTVEGAAGKKLLRAYEICIASECISESWLIEEFVP